MWIASYKDKSDEYVTVLDLGFGVSINYDSLLGGNNGSAVEQDCHLEGEDQDRMDLREILLKQKMRPF